MGSLYRSLGYSGGDWWLLGRLCNVSDRPGIFSKRLGEFGFFSGGTSCHIVFDAILSIVAQKLRIGLYFYMGEARSDVSKKSILSHRHTNSRVSPLHAHMANSKHKRLSIDAYVFFRIHTQMRKYITFSCHPLGKNSELSKLIMWVSASFGYQIITFYNV